MPILIKGAGGGAAPKIYDPFSEGDMSISVDRASTGNYTVTCTVENFPSNRKLIGLFVPMCLGATNLSYALMYMPDDENSIQGYWAGTKVVYLFKDDGSGYDGYSHVSVTQSDNTLTVVATLEQSDTSTYLVYPGLNVARIYYTE